MIHTHCIHLKMIDEYNKQLSRDSRCSRCIYIKQQWYDFILEKYLYIAYYNAEYWVLDLRGIFTGSIEKFDESSSLLVVVVFVLHIIFGICLIKL